MARRSMKAKIQPAVMKMNFTINQVDGGVTGDFNYIDLSQCVSIMNRRFYRQGLNWAVAGFKFITTGTGIVGVNKLPNTWVMGNAWEKTFRAWQKQQKEVLEDGNQESIKAKFNDFKIFASGDHLTKGVANNLLPIDSRFNTAAAGEWDMSQIVIPNFGSPGTNYEPYLIAVGPNVGGAGGAYSLVELYAKSRSVPQSPDPSVPGDVLGSSNILNLMFDDGDNNTDVLANASGKNNRLPYPVADYPGGDTQLPGLEIHDTEFVTSTTVGGTTHLDGGNFPCGLIEINTAFPTDTVIRVELTLVPGSHRGYLAESMTEM